jgi:feruloyl-CoA synthase
MLENLRDMSPAGYDCVPAAYIMELRISGPHVLPRYYRNEQLTAAAFDEEGFCCTGDAVPWRDPE